LLSYGAIEGNRVILFKDDKAVLSDRNIYSLIVPLAFQIIGYDVFADFKNMSVSEKPQDYWLIISEEDRLESVKGAKLRSANLNNSNMLDSYLVKANLSLALLKDADLQFANLEKAELYRTNLQRANLSHANLQQSKLYKTNMHEAILVEANFRNAWIKDINFQSANLEGAKNITEEQLCEVKTLYNAKLDSDLLEEVKKRCPHVLKKPKEDMDITEQGFFRGFLRGLRKN
jgi:uncharacterized protein YjbI with pentapeptide repeats